MADQQGKTSEFDIGWLAGFVDGEGSFNIHRIGFKTGAVGWRPWFTVAGTHAPTLERVSQIMDGMGIARHTSWSWDRRTNRKGLWRIQISGLLRMQRWLVAITPYLFTKREQAELLQQFVQLRLANPGWRRGLSAEETALVPLLITMNRAKPSEITRPAGLTTA